jgi:hypothetical protein
MDKRLFPASNLAGITRGHSIKAHDTAEDERLREAGHWARKAITVTPAGTNVNAHEMPSHEMRSKMMLQTIFRPKQIEGVLMRAVQVSHLSKRMHEAAHPILEPRLPVHEYPPLTHPGTVAYE